MNSNYRHLNEEVMAEERPGTWIPDIPLPFYTSVSGLFGIGRKQMYQCGCGAKFDHIGWYREHYRTEQLLEMNAKMARTRDLAKQKALYWRRYAYVIEFGNEDERDDLAELEGPEMHTISEMESLNRELEEIWGRVYLRQNKEANTNVGRMKDETEITDEDPAVAAKDMANKFYSHTNSKGVTYILHSREVSLRGGRMTRIYYFRKDVLHRDVEKELPKGYYVRENPRNGFLTIAKEENRGN